MLSLDSAVLEQGSPVQRRLISLADAVGEVAVLVPAEREGGIQLSHSLRVFAVSGSKKEQFGRLRRKGQELLMEKKYDLITVQDVYFLALVGYRLARKFGVPFEVQVHGFERFFGVRKLIARFVLRRARRVRVVSERLRRFVSDLVGDAKVYVLPVYSQLRTSPTLLSDGKQNAHEPFVFLTVGRLVAIKNTSMQLRAFAKLHTEFPNMRLVIVGDGPEAERLRTAAKELSLGDAVSFEGRQRSVERYYDRAGAFLLTSDSEGWGVAAIEAAEHGLPIIMTDVGLAGELIKNGESGLVVPVGNESALLLAMKQIVRDAHLRKRLGEQAFRAACSLPSPDAYIARQIEEWRRITAGSGKEF